MKHTKKLRIDRSDLIGLLFMIVLVIAAVCIHCAIFLPMYL